MNPICLALSALIFSFQSHQGITPIRNVVGLIPRNSVVQETNKIVAVAGVVTIPSTRTDSTLVSFIQDRTGGIMLFQFDYRGPVLFVGDSIVATGKLGVYYGQEEMISPQIRIVKRGVKVYPVSASVKQINNGTFHGFLVRCIGKIVARTFTLNGISIHFVDGNNDTAVAFADFRQDPQFDVDQIREGESFSITGVSSRFSAKKPFNGNDDLLLRSSADLRPIPEGFFFRHSSSIELIFTLVIALVFSLSVFSILLRTKVKQKTRQLEDQTGVLRLFFDSIAELTGVLDKKAILTLALQRGHALTGTRSVIFCETLPTDGSLLLTAFQLTGETLSVETQRFRSKSLSHVFREFPEGDAIWNTTMEKLIPDASSDGDDESLSEFLRSHVPGGNLTVIAPNPPAKDFLVAFDHVGPISSVLPRALIISYILHVYSAYRSAQLFDVVKEQGTALERLYNNSVFGLLTLSEQGTIQTANKVAMQMFEDENLIGKKVRDYMAHEDAARLDDLLVGVAAVSKEKFVRFAAEVNRPRNRGNFEFAIQFDPASKTFYATVQDTGVRGYYEDYAAKEKKIETLEKLASSLTHDLNNIVGSITGYASLLKRKLPQNSKEYHYADIVENSSRRATELVKEVLGFSQLDAKTLEVVDLNRFAADIISDFRKTHGEKYSLLLTPFGRSIRTRISTSQIRQVLLAILTNAVDAMENGGTIICSIGVEELPDSAPAQARSGEYCFVEVEDHGLGMDEAIRRRIFEPFFTTKRVKKYTGLSLSMAYNILKHHKGFIDVESTPGIGTRVKIFLPPYLQNVGSGQQAEPPKGFGIKGVKVLVVDDEEGVRQLAYDILSERGYTVLTANDGLQALECLKGSPDVKLVVLDMVMPGMGGKDTCIEIKKRPDAPKVLICTGYSELSDLESILGKHADGLLQKPYSTIEMIKAVDNLLYATSTEKSA